MPYKPKHIEKLYYSISEVSKMFTVAPSLIRFWEGEFDSLKPKKNSNGNRQFTKTDIEQIRLIYHLVKEKGYTLSGAKDVLKSGTNKPHSKMEVVNSLEKVKGFLLELKKNLA
ncbi:MAG: MerR family transcriptional regulator [Opitutaceae bacterium]|nr:MerR family transcriptional regulator [Cytophagales bacterium]